MAKPVKFVIQPVATELDLSDVKELFKAYTDSLGIDLTYQNFAEEMSSMPGRYSPSAGGALLLARDPLGSAIGCVALRLLPSTQKDERICEMKRLYCAPSSRGLGLGRALVDRIIDCAIKEGYKEMRLDTLSSMTGAIALYKKLGFLETGAYYETPIEGTLFLTKRLSA
ncbi:acetyltransferase [Xylogone sp. PMI_703]|nr:acetyltransferase [Xylogone sp. PMI_703]